VIFSSCDEGLAGGGRERGKRVVAALTGEIRVVNFQDGGEEADDRYDAFTGDQDGRPGQLMCSSPSPLRRRWS